MSYARQPSMHAPNRGRDSQAYRRASAVVRQRAANGEPCYFWGRHPQCPHPWINLQLPSQHRHAFTAHHLDRLMDGGTVLPDPTLMAPAHRGCNARDGLMAQNARRQGRTIHCTADPTPTPHTQWW
jgi:hypothetical protein